MTERTSDCNDDHYLGHALRQGHLMAAIDQISEPWSNSIIRAAFLGIRQFDAFQQALSIPRQTLSLRLAYLVKIGLLHKQPYQSQPVRHEYRLTQNGKKLHENVLASWSWDRRWGDPGKSIPRQLVHSVCLHEFKPLLVCEHCSESLTLRNVSAQLTYQALPSLARSVRNHRWRVASAEASSQSQRDILAVIDDRWSVLLIAAVALGFHRHDQFLQVLDISSAVLAQRLKRLGQLKLLKKTPDPQDARRSLYRLTQIGEDLFPYLLTITAWARTRQPGADTLNWQHKSCKKLVSGRMVCSHCSQAVLPHEVIRPDRV